MKPKTTPSTIRLTDRQRSALLREAVERLTTQSALVGAYCDALAKRHESDDKRAGK